MQTIYRCPIDITDKQHVSLPVGAQILTVERQYGQPCIWAIVDTEAPCERKVIYVFGLGDPMPEESLQYIGTIQTQNGNQIFHVFEAK